MADVELVIKLDEKLVEWINKYYDSIRILNDKKIGIIIEAIKNGKPILKGHGRLIDEKEVNIVVNGVFNSFDKCSPKTFLNVIHNQCIDVIETNGTESEE